jgi:hypothetical protein
MWKSATPPAVAVGNPLMIERRDRSARAARRRRPPRRVGSSRSLWDVTESLLRELLAAGARRQNERRCFPGDSRRRIASATQRIKTRT